MTQRDFVPNDLICWVLLELVGIFLSVLALNG